MLSGGSLSCNHPMPNDYATANLAFLQQSFPDLYLRLQANDFPAAALVPELQPSRQGSATLAVQAQGRTVYLHSRHDPLTEAARWAEAQRSSTGGVVLFLGWGLGYPVLEWCRRYGRQAPAVIVWEPEPAFFAASLSQVDLQPLQSLARLEIVLGADEPALYRALHRHLSLLLSHELLIKPLPFVALYPPATVASLKHQVQTIAHLQRNALRHMELMGQTIQRHLLANLRHAPDCRLPHELAGIAASQPGILVAAGPSLDKNVHHLRQAEGKAWIFAVDTSLRILQHRGIRADIVVTKDPTELNTAHFQGMENLQTPMLAFEPQVHPEIPQRFIGEKIWLPGRTHQLHYHLRTFELRQADDFPHSTNVALAAFNLAARMGCDPIIFVGLDLCFSEPGGASHAAAAALRANVRLDSPHGRLSYRRGDRQDEVEVVWVEGVDGNPYPSTSHFLEALRLLETLIHRQHALCIDATEGGARIAGTQLLPLQQALENFCRSEIAPSAVLRRCPRLRRSASLRQSVLAIAEYLESCDRLASEALALLETDADLSPDRLRTLDDYRGRIEQGQKLYQVLENSLERLIVEIDRPGFWDDPTIPPAERTRRYVWYFSQVHLAAQTGAALYLQAAEALAVDEEGSLPGGSELGKISPKT